MSSDATPVIVLSSGGKDSICMIDRLAGDSAWQIAGLVTTVNEANGRVAMHGTPRELIEAQAAALGLPLTTIGLPEDCDNAEYERRLAAGLQAFQAQGARHIACGDLFLADIRTWREDLFRRLGLEGLFPLWHEPTDRLARRLVDQGWQLTLTCVDTHRLPQHFLGRRFDHGLLDELPDDVDPCGENGEFHSFVHDGPGFSRPLALGFGRTVVTHERYAMLELVSKPQHLTMATRKPRLI